MGRNGPLGLGLEILPTGLGSKVGQNGPFYTTLGKIEDLRDFQINSFSSSFSTFSIQSGIFSILQFIGSKCVTILK